VSATHAVLLALAVVIFAVGWIARGRREAREHTVPGVAPIDQAIGTALTSFQAALALWQAQGPARPGLAERVIETFGQRREAVAALASGDGRFPQEREVLAREITALDRISAELAPLGDGAPLDLPRERALYRAERALAAARSHLLLAAVSPCLRTGA
jgi:hypothetical protein